MVECATPPSGIKGQVFFREGQAEKGKGELTQVREAACCGQEEAGECDLRPPSALSRHRPTRQVCDKGSEANVP